MGVEILDMTRKKEEIIPYLSYAIRNLFDVIDNELWEYVNEIRITVHKPLIINISGTKKYISENGLCSDENAAYTVTQDDMKMIFELITKSSVYAYNRHINEGFITLFGGNRVGICGKCSVYNDEIISVSDINSLNIRISHERRGASDIIFTDIYHGGKINNTLIISPPGCGKTTLLRDIALSLNDYCKTGKIIVCAIIDERFELACINNGISSFDIGQNNFVISGCDKSKAILQVVRSMSPDVIITDELVGENDFEAINYASASGCNVIASVHGFDDEINEIKNNDVIKVFKKIVVLSNNRGLGTVERVIDVV